MCGKSYHHGNRPPSLCVHVQSLPKCLQSICIFEGRKVSSNLVSSDRNSVFLPTYSAANLSMNNRSTAQSVSSSDDEDSSSEEEAVSEKTVSSHLEFFWKGMFNELLLSMKCFVSYFPQTVLLCWKTF